MGRECGGCTVCCYIGGVPELKKPPHHACPHVTAKGCGIYGQKIRPKTCNTFRCAWLRGIGSEDDRPDKSGVMLATHGTPRGLVGFAIEAKPFALRRSGLNAVVEFARESKLPVIASDYKSKPPNDTGDYVIVLDELAERCHRIIDESTRYRLADDVCMYLRTEP